MFKLRTTPLALAALSLFSLNLQAANVLFISRDDNKDVTMSNHVASLGHTVTRSLNGGGFEGTLDANDINTLNRNFDLIIFARNTNSGSWNDKAGWNSVKTPILQMNTYLVRSNRWDMFPTNDIQDSYTGDIRVDPSLINDPLLSGVDMTMDGFESGGKFRHFVGAPAPPDQISLPLTTDAGNSLFNITRNNSTNNFPMVTLWNAHTPYYTGGSTPSGERLFIAQVHRLSDMNDNGRTLLRNAINELLPEKGVLQDNFVLGDGRASTYTESNALGQGGGTGWSGSKWDVAGGNAEFNVTPDGLLIGKTDGAAGVQSMAYRSYRTAQEQTPYALTFDVTINDMAGLLDKATDDEIQFFDRPGANSQFGSTGTWLVRGYAGNNTENDLTWRVFDGTPLMADGFSHDSFVDSGIALQEDVGYEFALHFMGGGEFEIRITSTLGEAWTSDVLGYRSADAWPSGNLSLGLGDQGTFDNIGFTVHGVAIPEPGFFAAIFAGAMLLFAGWKRRRLS